MDLPNYWLHRPNQEINEQARSDFDRLLGKLRAGDRITRINYTFSVPKWQFLCYLSDQHGVVMHGTGNPDIQLFEPQRSHDLMEFGDQTAIYAAGDGLWPMFFAIVDRTKIRMATSNACVRLVDETGQVSEPHYVFSISEYALKKQPWRKGVVYLLPGETFINMPSLRYGSYEVRIPQLASLVPVRPFALLEVGPEDFPFLNDIRGIDDARLPEYGEAMQTGAPWPE